MFRCSDIVIAASEAENPPPLSDMEKHAGGLSCVSSLFGFGKGGLVVDRLGCPAAQM